MSAKLDFFLNGHMSRKRKEFEQRAIAKVGGKTKIQLLLKFSVGNTAEDVSFYN